MALFTTLIVENTNCRPLEFKTMHRAKLQKRDWRVDLEKSRKNRFNSRYDTNATQNHITNTRYLEFWITCLAGQCSITDLLKKVNDYIAYL